MNVHGGGQNACPAAQLVLEARRSACVAHDGRSDGHKNFNVVEIGLVSIVLSLDVVGVLDVQQNRSDDREP